MVLDLIGGGAELANFFGFSDAVLVGTAGATRECICPDEIEIDSLPKGGRTLS